MRMRIVFILAAAMLAAAGCGGADADGVDGVDGERTQVVAAFYPLEWLAEELGGANVEVRNLTPTGVEPHDFELSPRDIARLQEADVVLYVGRGFQPALEKALESVDGPEAIDVLEAPGIDLLRPKGSGRDVDPHVWLDPNRMRAVAQYVAPKLDADEAGVVAALDELDDSLDAGLRQCQRRELFTSHAAFSYLAERYDLEQVALTGLSPETEPSPRRLEELADKAEQAGATTIYFETLVPADLAEVIARQVGARTDVLDPLEGLSEERSERGDDYVDVMRDNLTALQAGLGCAP